MPFEIPLPAVVKKEGWKVKILDRERLEPPHVTIIRRVQKWRVSLRDRTFIVPPGGGWNDVHAGVRRAIEDNWNTLVQAWDTKYPENPVEGRDDD